MIRHRDIIDRELRSKIRRGEICFGGNEKLKIYGKLDCASGKRMKRNNRVFFHSEAKAKDSGYRPCGHCMRSEFIKWKADLLNNIAPLVRAGQ